MWHWLKYVEEERERAVEEASRNRVPMREDQLPQFECPVCREALQYAEEWLQWENIPELEKGCDQKEEVGHLIGTKCNMALAHAVVYRKLIYMELPRC